MRRCYRGGEEMGRCYSFRLGEGDEELVSLLDELGRDGERSAYIKRALLFYARYGQLLEEVAQGIRELRETLARGGRSGKEGNRDRREAGLEEYLLSGLGEWG